MDTKQVIVMKQFPGLRTGKYVAQGAHASMASLLSLGYMEDENLVIPLTDPFIREWLTGKFKKITLYVKTDEELLAIYDAAEGLPRSIIRDSGLTEFNGVVTLTAVGIGPADSALIDKITGSLKLF